MSRSRPAAQQGARDDRPSPRDWRRVVIQLLPQQGAFKNRSARLLAEYADAVLSEEGWEAWIAAHPGEDVLPAELRR